MRSDAGRGPLWRVLGLALAGAVLSAQECGDNLGKTEPSRATFRVSVGSGTTPSDGSSLNASISSNGDFVAFASDARNLAPAEGLFREIFVSDRPRGIVANVSRLAEISIPALARDCDSPAISAGGRYVVFESKGILVGNEPSVPGTTNLFVRDLQTGVLRRVVDSVWPNADCKEATISGNGRYVAFQSAATNLGFNPTNIIQVYAADMNANPPTLTLVSRASASPTVIADRDAIEPRVSADGTAVVFVSSATNLHSDSGTPAIQEVFVGTPAGSPVELVSRASGGAGARADNTCFIPAITGDGRFVAFHSMATNLVTGITVPSIYVRDRNPPFTTSHVTSDMTIADLIGISDDGRLVCFSIGTLFQNQQIHVRDWQAGSTIVASVNRQGSQSNFWSNQSAISGDGRWVVWQTPAENLVVGDVNGLVDIYGHGPLR